MPRTASPAAAYVGQQIRRLREERHMTQDQLAVGANIDSANIRSFESGRAMPSVYSVVRISEALDCSPGNLLDGLTSPLFESRHRTA